MEAGLQKDQAKIKSLELSVPPPYSRRKVGKLVNRLCRRDEASIKIPKVRYSENFWVGKHTHMPGGWHILQIDGDRSSCVWDPSRPCPMYLFIWLFTCILYHTPYYIISQINVNKSFPQLCELF